MYQARFIQSTHPFQKFIAIFTLSLLLSGVSIDFARVQASENKDQLVLLNWEEFLDPELIQKFEAAFKVKVKEVYFDSESERNTILSNSNTTGYDLVLLSRSEIPSFIKRKWIATFDESKIPNIEHVDARWLFGTSKGEVYAIPYVWGTTGIVYRKDLVPAPVTSWKQFFKPPEILRNKILSLEEPDTIVGMALKALGYKFNSSNTKELAEAEKLLLLQKPFVRGYSTLVLTEDSLMVTGEIWMAITYSGDAITLQEFNPAITYVIPEEGGSLWTDSWGLLRTSPNKELATAFVNFLHDPENAAATALYTNYATPNQAAKKLLPAEHLNNTGIYPPEGVLGKCEFYEILNPRASRKRNSIFSKIYKDE